MMDYYCRQKCVLIRFMGICSLMVVHGENAFFVPRVFSTNIVSSYWQKLRSRLNIPLTVSVWYNIQQIYDIIGPVIIIAVGGGKPIFIAITMS